MVFRQLILSQLGQVFGIVKEPGTLMKMSPAAATTATATATAAAATAAGVEELS